MGREYKFARIFEGEEQKKQYAKDRFKAKLAEKVMVQIEEEIRKNRQAKAEKVWEVVPEFDIMNEMGSSPRLPRNKQNADGDAVAVFDAGAPECKEMNDEELPAGVEKGDAAFDALSLESLDWPRSRTITAAEAQEIERRHQKRR